MEERVKEKHTVTSPHISGSRKRVYYTNATPQGSRNKVAKPADEEANEEQNARTSCAAGLNVQQGNLQSSTHAVNDKQVNGSTTQMKRQEEEQMGDTLAQSTGRRKETSESTRDLKSDTDLLPQEITANNNGDQQMVIMFCPVIIGSFQISGPIPIEVSPESFKFKVPFKAKVGVTETANIVLKDSEIKQVYKHFGPDSTVFIIHVTPACGEEIRKQLHMFQGSRHYLDPEGQDDWQKFIILAAESTDNIKNVLRNSFSGERIAREIDSKLAFDIAYILTWLRKSMEPVQVRSCARSQNNPLDIPSSSHLDIQRENTMVKKKVQEEQASGNSSNHLIKDTHILPDESTDNHGGEQRKVFMCRGVRIGSLKIEPSYDKDRMAVAVSSEGFKFLAPIPKRGKETTNIVLKKHDISQVRIFYGAKNPLIFILTTSACGRRICKQLHMNQGDPHYFAPKGHDYRLKIITFFIVNGRDLTDIHRILLNYHLPGRCILNIDYNLANKILVKSTSEDVPAVPLQASNCTRSELNPFNKPNSSHLDMVSDEEEIVEDSLSRNEVREEEASVFMCRRVRIGSLNIDPPDGETQMPIKVSSGCFKFQAPTLRGTPETTNIILKTDDISEATGSFGRCMPLLFICTTPACGKKIREQLHMTKEDIRYFDPEGQNFQQKFITFLIEKMTYEIEILLRDCFSGRSILKVVEVKTANKILVRSSSPLVPPLKLSHCARSEMNPFNEPNSSHLNVEREEEVANAPVINREVPEEGASTSPLEDSNSSTDIFPDEIAVNGKEEQKMKIMCRYVKIGSFIINPDGKTHVPVEVSSEGFKFQVPIPKRDTETTSIVVKENDIKTVLGCFVDCLATVVIHTAPACGEMFRKQLHMSKEDINYFDPGGQDCQEKIQLIMDITDESRNFLKNCFPGKTVMNEALVSHDSLSKLQVSHCAKSEMNPFDEPNSSHLNVEMEEEVANAPVVNREVPEEGASTSPLEDLNSSTEILPNEIALNGKEEQQMKFMCRYVKIGSFKINPPDGETHVAVEVSSDGFKFQAPIPKRDTETASIVLKENDIENVLGCFVDCLAIVVIRPTLACGEKVRKQLHMSKGDIDYFDPGGQDDQQNNIIFGNITDESRNFLKNCLPRKRIMKEVGLIADDSLFKSQNVAVDINPVATAINAVSQIVTKLGKKYRPRTDTLLKTDGITITHKDLAGFQEGNFINDTVIDFYLKYLMNQKLSEVDRKRTHVFSSFFYSSLTQKKEVESGAEGSIMNALRRHFDVKKWTQNVDIFEKDFIIVPINQNRHWLLAIICFPGLVSTETRPSLQKNGYNSAECMTSTVEEKDYEVPNKNLLSMEVDEMPVKSAAEQTCADEVQNSSKEVRSSDDMSNSSEDVILHIPEIITCSDHAYHEKMPCILIFDSLHRENSYQIGAHSNAIIPYRFKIINTLREYLQIEWEMKKTTSCLFSKTSITGHIISVPQRTKKFDSGVYVLQYVESFFENPFPYFAHQMPDCSTWFPPEKVNNKKSEIKELISQLQEQLPSKDK